MSRLNLLLPWLLIPFLIWEMMNGFFLSQNVHLNLYWLTKYGLLGSTHIFLTYILYSTSEFKNCVNQKSLPGLGKLGFIFLVLLIANYLTLEKNLVGPAVAGWMAALFLIATRFHHLRQFQGMSFRMGFRSEKTPTNLSQPVQKLHRLEKILNWRFILLIIPTTRPIDLQTLTFGNFVWGASIAKYALYAGVVLGTAVMILPFLLIRKNSLKFSKSAFGLRYFFPLLYSHSATARLSMQVIHGFEYFEIGTERIKQTKKYAVLKWTYFLLFILAVLVMIFHDILFQSQLVPESVGRILYSINASLLLTHIYLDYALFKMKDPTILETHRALDQAS